MREATAGLIDERVPWLDEEIEAALRTGAQDLELYDWARYHLGWRNHLLQETDAAGRKRHGGKRLRGVLTILAAEATGGDGRAAAAAGAAVELVHNFSLVHDDVEDHDEERRHRPTVWKLWGIPHAINVGSNLQAMVDVALLRVADQYPPGRVVECFRILTRAIVLMTEGQYLDIAAQDAGRMTLLDYFRMTGGKTAALIEAALRLGGQLGCDDCTRVEALGGFGRCFGLAFQCRDDYLGIWGEPEVTGKPVASDLASGKRSLPVVHAMNRLGPESAAGKALRSALVAREIPVILSILDDLGTAGWVSEQVEAQTEEALRYLARASCLEPYGAAIRDIAHYALQRHS